MEFFISLFYIFGCVIISIQFSQKKIGSIYSFLFCFLLTPILGIPVIFLIEKLPKKIIEFKIIGLIGRIFYYISVFILFLLSFHFYQIIKISNSNENAAISDSISLKNNDYIKDANKVVFTENKFLIETKSFEYKVIPDSIIHDNYNLTEEENKIISKINNLQSQINSLVDEINNDVSNNKNVSNKIEKYNNLIDIHQKEKQLYINKHFYKKFKIERPSWLYFKSNRNILYFSILLIYIALFGRFISDLQRNKITH